MNTIGFTKSDSDTLIFHIWKSLKYTNRLFISLSLIVLGAIIQIFQLEMIPGIFLVFAGNLFLLSKGIDTRLNKVVYKADANWSKVSQEQIDQIEKINTKSSKWDLSAVDISSGLGAVLLVILLLACLIFANIWLYSEHPELNILIANLLVLLVPHWITGVKRITKTPKLLKKIDIYKKLIKSCQNALAKHNLEYNLLLQGEKDKLPKDIKIRIQINNQPDDFLGVYGQLNLNDVEGKLYPYFYTVLVAKKSFNLLSYANRIRLIPGTVLEQKPADDIDVIVLRQQTTKNSGYNTSPQTMINILKLGVHSAENII